MASTIVNRKGTFTMRVCNQHPALAQQAPSLSDLLIVAQLLSLFANALRNGAGRVLDFIILLFSI
jgi:hypothetical protein